MRDLESVAGFVVLQLHLDWEFFLEAAYHRFLCGWTNGQGSAPTLLVRSQQSLSHASVFVRTVNRTNQAARLQKYAAWGRDSVEARARTHFQNGEPFISAIRPAIVAIDDFYAVRNRLAHRSAASIGAFHLVIRRELGRVPRGITPGRFLLTTNRNATGGLSYLDTYVRTLGVVAQTVAG